MCERSSYRKKPSSRIDRCMTNLIDRMDGCENLQTIASCCGHGRYPMTIVARNQFGGIYEVMSDVPLRSTQKKFYKRDMDGYYYIPEVLRHLGIKPYIPE